VSVALQLADALQRKASDPRGSAWVSANAGCGKTHVLAQRVVRLLIDGAEPSKLLCLTFTKAAAANMAERVFDRLARWTQIDEPALAAELAAMDAPAAPADLERARKLFARVLETPGGLKIQTLHAFCERVLHLFPFEANVPAGFHPLDEREAAMLREQAQARVFAGAERDAALSAAIARVAQHAGPDGFAPLIAETARLGAALTLHGAPDAYAAKLAERLGLSPGEDEAAVARAMREDGGGPAVWKAWAAALAKGSANDQKLAAILAGAAAMAEDSLEVYLSAFLTKEMTPRKTLATKATAERFPDLVDALYAERDRLCALLDKRRAAQAVARSRDLCLLSRACETAYARAKAARSALDFDDLIAKTESLFENADAAWVLYKLDRGVEHILVDEAQDTSRPQWKILSKLAEDFLSGEGAVSRRRTFFAVGDEKQSIFSFQGAAPHLFDRMLRWFETRHHKAERGFEHVRLTYSFRSAPAVLGAVDKVFAHPTVWAGVSAGETAAPPHEAIRDSLPGMVELWPPVTSEPAPEPGDWALPLDAQKQTHPAHALAERVAGVIAQWTAPGSPERIVDKTGAARPVRPGDILILVRSRGPLFEALTRALRRARIPAAGADRLTLGRHIAVLDLCAAARSALNPDDDLALAAALKSPLIGLDDDALIRIAPGRRGSLSLALAQSEYAQAHAKLETWRERAKLSPFDFFARLLGADGGRRALIGRLGPEAGDAIDEFLARALLHETSEAPSLAGFVAETEAAESQIKRDMEAAGDEVRVMTVHASKGLEAPIVFLPDTHGAPSGRHDPKWLRLAPPHSGAPPLLVWGGKADEDCAAMAEGRAQARAEAAGEHRRLLYVAMTRAAQRLIVAGYEGAKARPADCWANLIAAGLEPHLTPAPSWWDPSQTLGRLGAGPKAAAPPAPESPDPAPPPPAWASEPAPHEVAYRLVAPSRRVAGALTPERLARVEEGRLAHRLMQSLPDVAPERRRAAAEAFLARHGATLAAERRAGLVARALALIEAPALATLFGPGSRAEVPVIAALPRIDGETASVSGRIDRLAAAGGQVWIADYKTGPASMRREYERQLALYRAAALSMFPGAEVRAFLLWLDDGGFQELPAQTLSKAYQDWAGET
jgi:ATP-dependent helicase/nuclease subunit A